MLGAILTTVVSLLITAGLPGRHDAEMYDTAVSDGKILVGVPLTGGREPETVRTALNELIDELCDEAGASHDDVLDIVLVGHSGGGPLIQLVAEAMPERIGRVVFVDAWVLRDGRVVERELAFSDDQV